MTSKNRTGRKAKNSITASNGGWIRMMSPEHTGYRVLVSPRQLQAFGQPKDPWGRKMIPAKGVAPRIVQRAN